MRIKIPGYTVNDKPLYNGSATLVFHAIKHEGHQPVVIKIIKNEHPSPNEIFRFKNECRITQSFNDPFIVHVNDVVPYHDSNALILENIMGPSLSELLLSKGKFDTSSFLKIAITLVNIVRVIHQNHIIHKDINPSNLIWDEKNQCIKIIDFGISTSLSREKSIVTTTQQLEGTLAYLSPEQTGRMNRGVDYRSDYYSLGMVFYHMITGKPVFEKKDTMDYVYAHLAIKPESPHKINPDIPIILSELIMRLIEKNPEKRYQSDHGLLFDLKKCQEQWNSNHCINEFPLGEKENYNQFKIPEKLYGREEETNLLLKQYRSMVLGEIQLVFIFGYSGIGKTSLINELQKTIVRSHGYYISGKFEQFKHNIPYAAIIQALNNLFEQLLSESDEKINYFRDEILKLGENAAVLAEVLPHLQEIIGESKPASPLGLLEAKNRLDYAFQQLILILSKKEHPLTLFLDDLQWADLASLKIIETLLIHKNIKHLLILCSYRDNEINESHPLNLLFNELKEKNLPFNNILLSPLTFENVEEFCSDLLHQEGREASEFAQLCYQKTAGNPFFLTKWLEQLYIDKDLFFDVAMNKWCWSLEAIHSKSMMDNIADLMTKKINQLPENVRKILKMASCVGNQFTSKIISSLGEFNEEQVIELLQEALENELIITSQKEKKLVYQFAHDRIEKAVYSLLTSEEKAINHLTLARVFKHNKLTNDDHELVFEMANQYNKVIRYGFIHLMDSKEQQNLVEINLLAAQLAKLAGAFDHALKYIKKGLKNTKNMSWEANHELLFSLYHVGMEAAYLSGKLQLMEKYFDIAFPHSNSVYDRLKIIKIKILSLVARAKHHEAIDLVIATLPELGIKISRNPGTFSILGMFIKIKFKLIGKSINSLADLPEMQDPEKKEILYLLTSMMPSTYSVQPNLIPILIGTVILISLKYGNTKESAIAYTSYGVLLCGILYNIKDGYEFGSLGSAVLDKLGVNDERAKITFLNYAFIKYWKDHIQLSFPEMIGNYHYGLEKGEIEYACYSIMSFAINALLSGVPLNDYIHTLETYESPILQLGQKNSYNYTSLNHQAALNLIEPLANPEILVGKVFDENKKIPIYIKKQDKTALFFLGVNKLMLFYLFDQCENHIDEIYKNIIRCELNKDGVLASFMNTYFHLYKTLVLSEIYPAASFLNKVKIRKSFRNSLKLMNIWSKNNPLVCEGKYFLIKAIFAEMVHKNRNSVISLYEKAILFTQRSKISNESGIANEKLGRFYLKENNEKLAKVYLQDARYYYGLWGATAKINHFDTYYENLFFFNESQSFQLNNGTTATQSTTTQVNSKILDIDAMQKASQMIAGTIDIHHLLEKLLRTLTENAGAEYCCLLLKKETTYLIEAEKYSDNREGSILSAKKMDSNVLPLMIINYVIHKKDSLVLDNAASSNTYYAKDPYIIKNKTKSILCMPLLNRNHLTGVLYLENNLAAYAFTNERVMLLSLLSSQIAIAIDNAHLYSDIKKSNAQLVRLNKAYERFVPKNFINLLNKKSIVDVKLGSQTQRNMTVLFTDIRDFTSISEQLSPKDNFNFVNVFLSYMEPVISKFHGFIDKYIGDSIMALFPTNEDDAIQCAIAMIHALKQYNLDHFKVNQKEIKIGIGLNSGKLLLGTVGNKKRMDATVISDTVNIASRVESQTKIYGKPILITEYVYQKLTNPSKYRIEQIDSIVMKGKTIPITLYSVDPTHYKLE